ncbi:btk-binding protein-related [Anaeramoeba flamelloides]|uniref:Btk-binding protein-related n=1 Tax=Anaeramoeba flamelloides TaxID=1746091 RepID=A0ABQ8ZBN0_9EUKA|nr:btk-binding protein-related [Anaeramoeba flamelloides]
MSEKKEKQPLYCIQGTSVSNFTKHNTYNLKFGSGGDSCHAYVDETTTLFRKKFGYKIKEIRFSTITNVVQVAAGYCHCIFLTAEGNVYGFGSGTYGDLGEKNSGSRSNFHQFQYFPKNNLKIRKIAAGVFQSYFITTENKFYGCGSNEDHRLGSMSQKDSFRKPTLMQEKNISDVWSGNYAYTCYFREEESGKVIGMGKTVPKNPFTLTEDKSVKGKEIVHIEGGNSAFLFLVRTQEGEPQVYICKDKKDIVLWKELSGLKVNYFSMCCHNSVLTTEDNKVLVSDSTGRNFEDITYKLPEIEDSQRWQISAHAWDSLIFPVEEFGLKSIYQDFKNIYENQILVDCKLPNTKLKVHKFWLEWRFKNSFANIERAFADLNSEACEELVKWCYGMNNKKLSADSLNFLISFKLNQKTTLSNELLQLYLDEENKLFSLLVRVHGDVDEQEEVEEEEFEEIPVHKFILLARSGLYRDLFQNVQENSNSVKDFSGKAIESLEILVKYLYTSQIELTADDDPQIIVEDLEDAIEYFQLNEKCNLKILLNKITKKYNLN